MLFCTRTIVMALAAGIAGVAFGGDAYYEIPIRELKLTEGELPVRKEITRWRSSSERERLRAMRPYAVLDGPGEVYVVGRGEPPYSPPGLGTQVCIRAPEGKAVTGRLYVPNAELTGMIVLKFTIPATVAKAEAKKPFYEAKNVHYEILRNRDIPGGMFFPYSATTT